MNFDKWFNENKLWVKIVLLAIPLCGWLMELFTRLSIYLRSKKTIDLIFFIVAIVISFPVIVLDIVWLAIKGHMFLSDDFKDVTDDKEHVDGEKKPEEEKEEK